MSNARFSVLQSRAVSDSRVSDSQFRTLAALGMYADKDGWCFPSLKTLAKDRNKSPQAVGRDTIALRKLGYIEVRNRADGKTRARKSNLYRLKFDLPYQRDVDTLSTPDVDTLSTPDVEHNAPENAPINPETSSTSKIEKRGDLVQGLIDFAQMPGAKKSIRLDALASLIKVRFGIEPTRRKWIDFLNYADKAQQERGESVVVFFDWLESQKGFDVSFWPPDKMQENWSRAFMKPSKEETPITRAEDNTEKLTTRPKGLTWDK